jgi:hypothetical protein
MSYSTDKLIAIFGCNLSDLINIEKEILKKPVVKTINSPDFLMHFFDNLPLCEFTQNLKVNRNWHSACKRELFIRRNNYRNQYWKTVKEFILAENKRFKRHQEKSCKIDCIWLEMEHEEGKQWHLKDLERDPLWKEYCRLGSKMYEIFDKQVKVEYALVRLGFINQLQTPEEYTQVRWRRELHADYRDPYDEVKSEAEVPEKAKEYKLWNCEEYGVEDWVFF